MIFAGSLDPDQARHNVGPDLDPSCLTAVITERIFEKCYVEKYLQTTKIVKNYPACREFNAFQILDPIINS